ncbi:MAG: NAD(P)-dependent glycerol-3-phosphate dehydrogenase [Kiritimatiellae bacterium]|nr:NAD(P)-dependent glycerol-3-phosphate dehydrogenase [Kiritimatiellia bacterium]
MKLTVIGDGGWGTANALLLSGYGHEVTIWGAFKDYIEEMRLTRRNERFLKGVEIPESIALEYEPKKAVEGAEIVVLAPPSKFFSSVMERFKGLITKDMLVVSLTKGLCEKTNKRMTELAEEILGIDNVVALAGPTHAEEVSRSIPTTIVAACKDGEKAKMVQKIWSGPLFRVYTSPDPVGVEIGGAVKNVIAIAVGCSDGMGFGDNTRAALITRGLAEMRRFVIAYGGKPETVSGLAGIGDLIVTCTSQHSRNHSVGERLGKGEKIERILSSMQMVAEGVWNSRVIYDLSKKLGVEMPICSLVYSLCYENFDASKAVEAIMSRELKSE